MSDQLEQNAEQNRMDLGDTSFDPILDGIIDAPPPRPARPKDPKTGKFLPSEPPVERQEEREQPREQPTRHQHPKALVRRAIDLGYTENEIAARDTDTLLDEVHTEEARELRELRRQSLHQKSQDSAPVFEQPTAEPHSDEDRELGLDESTLLDLSPDVKKLLHTFHKKNKELEDKFQKLEQMEQTRQNMSRAQIIDQTFNSLGLSQIFGKGEFEQLDQKQKNLRLKVVRLAAMEDPKDTLPARIKRVAVDLYGDIVQAPTRDAGYEDVDTDPLERGNRRPTPDEWNAATLSRPDNRSPHSADDLPKGEARALRNASRRLGQPINGSDEEKSRMLGN